MPKGRISEHQGARTVINVGVKTGKTGGKFDPSRCGGHKNLENDATFSKFLGRRTNFPPHPQFSDTQPSNHTHQSNIFTLPIPGIRAVSTLPRQNHPPKTGKTLQLRPHFPSREGATAPGGSKRHQKRGTAGKYAEVITGKAGKKFHPGRCGERFYAEGQDFRTSRGTDSNKCGSKDRKNRGKV